ncbi:XRE family transcriptional regulator [Herminiimonas sp. KBW02]|uniref:helix-turn-helix domain-containing protein n=1 Tax=Herminiimonas sp. KBW02 TaxID=2153363 RepID=UPI000F5A5C80|nr:helix-turn-helix transcriptional regulator [Herminiimonas sp. KBW02]RQO37230.1 XRE family transcriptional regulator [Herminiimonas sp. KBW02]
MKIEFTKEWCMRMAHLENDAAISAGAFSFDPVLDVEQEEVESFLEEPNIAFGRFVSLIRRKNRLSLERLAEDTDIEIEELVEIEADTRHKPEPRTVYQLANYFKIPRSNLMQIAGLTIPKDIHLHSEAIRFAARSDPNADLSDEERAALEAFVSVLIDKK